MKTKWSHCFMHQFTLNFNNSASYTYSGYNQIEQVRELKQSFRRLLKDHQTESGKMIKLLRKFQNIFTRPDEISPDSVRQSYLFRKDCSKYAPGTHCMAISKSRKQFT